MKNFLFTTLANCNIFIANIVRNIAEGVIYVNGRLGWIVLSFVDKQRMQHAQVAVEQEEEISELNILFTITQVRNNAMKSGRWNEEHEDQLNFLGNVLANEHDWEVEDVERYLHEVIATGPALNMEE